MKYIKTFEITSEEQKAKDLDRIDLLRDLLQQNPDHETHDFYIFIGREDFKEEKNGLYKKSIEIENMVRITPDASSVTAMAGLEMRARFKHDSKLYNIWLPIEIREEVEGKGSSSLDPWLVDLINKHKSSGGDQQSRDIYQNTLQRRKDTSKYNL